MTEKPQGSIQDWVTQYGDDMYRWAIHKTSDKDMAADLVQDTFMAAHLAKDKFQGKSSPKTWLFSILNRKIIDHHRKKFKESTINMSQLNARLDGGDVMETFFDNAGGWRGESSPLDWNEMDGHLLDDSDFKNVLDACMQDLPEHWHAAMQLKYLEGKDGKDICQELGITSSNYWQILHRAKLKLRLCIENNWFK